MIDCTKETPEQKGLRDRYGVEGFPTIVFLDPMGRLVDRVSGMQQADALKARLRDLASRHDTALRLRKAASELGELGKWIEERIVRLGHDDIVVREAATADLRNLRVALDAALQLAGRTGTPEVRSRAADVAVPRVAAPLSIVVAAHTVVQEGRYRVEFDCMSHDKVFFAITGGVPARIELVNEKGDRTRIPPQGGDLPKGFGVPVRMLIYDKAGE